MGRIQIPVVVDDQGAMSWEYLADLEVDTGIWITWAGYAPPVSYLRLLGALRRHALYITGTTSGCSFVQQTNNDCSPYWWSWTSSASRRP